jgi:ATP-binding cassette subfamily B protein
MADRIIVLDQGAVVESGSHDELIAGKGLYADLFWLQAEGYR